MSYDIASFWALVDVKDNVDECWLWLGPTDAAGYGVFKGQRAHRMSLFFSGVNPGKGQDVNHRCETVGCVSPFHLQVMTHSDHSRWTRYRTVKKAS